MTAEGLTTELLTVAQEARNGDAWGAAVTAYRTVGLLHGLLVPKKNEDPGNNVFISRLPEEAKPSLGPCFCRTLSYKRSCALP